MTYVYLVEAYTPYEEGSVEAVFDTETAAKKYAARRQRKNQYPHFLVYKHRVYKAKVQPQERK